MAGAEAGKWRGVVTEVISAPIEKVWPILSDFDGMRRLFPQIVSSCHTVEGEKNKVGSLRVVTVPAPDGSGTMEARERLISIDDVNHTTSYSLEWVNVGWTGCEGNIDVKSAENGHTLVVWTFELDPINGQTAEQYLPILKGLFSAILNLTKGLVAE